MDNRFGFKDLVLTVLLLAILASIWLGMKQAGRQHSTLVAVTQEVGQQSASQARLERMLAEMSETLAEGVPVAAVPGGVATLSASPTADGFVPTAQLPDPFADRSKVQAASDYAGGDWVVDAFPVNVAKITPVIARDLYGSIVQSYVLESLAIRDSDTFSWMPLIARTWKTEPNVEAWQAYVDLRMAVPLTEDEVRQEEGFKKSTDETAKARHLAKRLAEGRRVEDVALENDCPAAVTVTFRLRRGLTFSDGVPLTSADFVFTHDLVAHPLVDAGPWRAGTTDKLKSVVAPDAHTVVFAFNQPYYDAFETAASFNAIPSHFYGPLNEENINRFNAEPGMLLGSGPYKVAAGPTTWSPGQEIVLDRNDRYWGDAPAPERLVFREITSDVARLTAFKNGDVDLFNRAIPEQYVNFKSDSDLVARSQSVEAFRVNDGYGWIAWNQKKNGKPTPFADVRVRRAMTMLIDRQKIIDEPLRGYGMIPSGPFNALSPQFNADVKPLAFDPEAARALLKEAGYEDRNGDGVVESEGGIPLAFKHTYPSSGSFWNGVSLMVKDSMAQGGVKFIPDPLEWSVFSEKVRSSDYDSISMAWGAGIETDIHHAFHSSQIGGGANNFPAYANAELDEIIDRARVTLDEEERMALWRRAHAILNTDQPYTFLYLRKYLMMADGRFKNFRETKVGTNDRTDWYVPTGRQKY